MIDEKSKTVFVLKAMALSGLRFVALWYFFLGGIVVSSISRLSETNTVFDPLILSIIGLIIIKETYWFPLDVI
jgi:hypothetical protein